MDDTLARHCKTAARKSIKKFASERHVFLPRHKEFGWIKNICLCVMCEGTTVVHVGIYVPRSLCSLFVPLTFLFVLSRLGLFSFHLAPVGTEVWAWILWYCQLLLQFPWEASVWGNRCKKAVTGPDLLDDALVTRGRGCLAGSLKFTWWSKSGRVSIVIAEALLLAICSRLSPCFHDPFAVG